VELEPGSRTDDSWLVAPDSSPADLWRGSAPDGAAVGSCEQLSSETDAEDGNTEIIRPPNPLQFREQPGADPVVLPGTPWCSHRHDDVELAWIRKRERGVGGSEVLGGHDDLLDDLESTSRELLGNRPGRAYVIVLEEEGSHALVSQESLGA
jgi:hypothetical protein